MTETSHARSRRAALYGLVLQVLACGAMLGLGYATHSTATTHLGWYGLGGASIWFVALLVFRQRELAALEAMDLEELRREKQATGGGQAIFDQEGGAGLGFMVAENRLRWMLRWLIPGFGLLTAAYLVVAGILLWRRLPGGVREPVWGQLDSVPLALIGLAITMLLLFLFSRFASGMGRVPQWQLLRACGSYMLGSAVGALAVIICLGLYLYASVTGWEHALAYVLPVLMVVLGAETFLNFVLDIYRPRTPGTEPRACFDSRLLGLIAEPGGIAHTIAEALNYQFGFQVSQTWFYQLLQRTFVPLVAFGLAALWLLTCVVVVQPYEMGIIERFGRQVNAGDPLAPGLHWKWPWPIEIARAYNTGQLHEIIIGRKTERTDRQQEPPNVELWTDARHGGYEHFNFLIHPVPGRALEPAARSDHGDTVQTVGAADAGPQAVAVSIMRLHVTVQYKILSARLAAFTRSVQDPHEALLATAWEEVLRFTAATHFDALLGEQRAVAGRMLRDAITRRIDELDLGLELVYVGVQNIHPEQTVAKAFRKVVTARQEKIAEIRAARVKESQTLARVGGDLQKAITVATAIDNVHSYEVALNRAEAELREVDPAMRQRVRERLEQERPLFVALIAARCDRDLAREEFDRAAQEFELGIGRSPREVARAREHLDQTTATMEQATNALASVLDALRAREFAAVRPAPVDALVSATEARFALEYWNGERERQLTGLEGEAAIVLADALATRWTTEMKAAAEVARLQNEIDAHHVSPRIYKARRLLQVLKDGLKKSRKYFLAFDPGDRTVWVRVEAQEQARPELGEMPTRAPQ